MSRREKKKPSKIKIKREFRNREHTTVGIYILTDEFQSRTFVKYLMLLTIFRAVITFNFSYKHFVTSARACTLCSYISILLFFVAFYHLRCICINIHIYMCVSLFFYSLFTSTLIKYFCIFALAVKNNLCVKISQKSL